MARIMTSADGPERVEFDRLLKDRGALADVIHYLRKYCRPNGQNARAFALNIFNFVNWMPTYDFKTNFLPDLIGGITLGIVLIPQTMGYSLNGVRFIHIGY